MDYKIVFEDSHNVQIQIDDVSFCIEKETDTLYELTNAGEPTDVVIPRIFPSGHQIKYLCSTTVDSISYGKFMICGAFNTITISDGIIVGSEAFQGSKVKKVVWNDCPCIPKYCFYDSEVEEVANIENVEEIMGFAFSSCNMKEVVWPKHCDVIPESCFMYSLLSKLIAPNVKKIEEYAFAFSEIEIFDWPAGCTEISKRCFSCSKLTKINNIDRVTAIRELAFVNTKLEALDLSDTNISYLAPEALEGLPEGCKLTLPYYITSEICTEAMGV